MGFFRKTKGSIISDAFMLIEDHANLKAKLMYDIALYEEYLTIKLAFGKQEATLSYNQITDIFYGMETEIIKINPRDIKLLEVNARYMKPDEYQKLVANIKKDGQLTSVPFCYYNKKQPHLPVQNWKFSERILCRHSA